MSGQLNAFWRLTGRRVFARLGMRAITAAIKVGRLSRDSGRYLVGSVQLREQFKMGNVASLRRKNFRWVRRFPPGRVAPAILDDTASALEDWPARIYRACVLERNTSDRVRISVRKKGLRLRCRRSFCLS
jgi:hypothetical protein